MSMGCFDPSGMQIMEESAAMDGMARLRQQIDFLVELDKVKHIFRQSALMDQSRKENDAEHSWHIAVMAFVLAEYAAVEIDIARVVRMLLVHDVVEIDAGDTFLYDEDGARDKAQRERQAANRIFALLPPDQEAVYRAAWEEFEARETPEAKYAAALDRLQPLLLHYHTQGVVWQYHGITADRVLARNRHIAEGAPSLWEFARQLIRESVEKGYLAE